MRKIVGQGTYEGFIFAACEDGTFWRYNPNEDEWAQMNSIPEGKEASAKVLSVLIEILSEIVIKRYAPAIPIEEVRDMILLAYKKAKHICGEREDGA